MINSFDIDTLQSSDFGSHFTFMQMKGVEKYSIPLGNVKLD